MSLSIKEWRVAGQTIHKGGIANCSQELVVTSQHTNEKATKIEIKGNVSDEDCL